MAKWRQTDPCIAVPFQGQYLKGVAIHAKCVQLPPRHKRSCVSSSCKAVTGKAWMKHFGGCVWHIYAKGAERCTDYLCKGSETQCDASLSIKIQHHEKAIQLLEFVHPICLFRVKFYISPHEPACTLYAIRVLPILTIDISV